jgi:hypothetical protein
MSKAKFITEVTVTDPDTNLPVEVAIYKHEGGGMFGVDSSYLDQCVDEENPKIPDPFSMSGCFVVYVELED